MKKLLFVIGLFAILGFSSSCKKDETKSTSTQSTPSGYFVNVTINGVDYNEIGDIGYGFYESQDGCDGKIYTLHTLNTGIRTSTFSFSMNLNHRQNNSDFSTLTLGSYSVKKNLWPSNDSLLCNWDLAIGYNDKTLTDQSTTVEPDGIHNVTAITYLSETNTQVQYNVEGNFDFSVKNSANLIIHITGSYREYIQTYK